MPEEKQPTRAKRPQFPEQYYQDPMGLDRYVVQEKILFEWRAPSKIERKHQGTERLYLTLIIFFCILVAVLLGEFVVALVFTVMSGLYFLLMTSKPLFLNCSITTLGVKVGEKYYFWSDVSQFWFEDRGESRVLYLRVVFPQLQKVRLIIHPSDEEEIQTKLGTYLLYKKPQQTTSEKLWRQLTEKLPIDLEFLQL
ncbi:hypothetical protein H3C70_02165 [Patescibacteria group bacterium]|nr:hypothetical protein [Patescibacteria group bacterium]